VVNIKDVAKKAGVSMMTVSRVINDNGAVSAETRKKVEQAVKDLDYIPNQIAKSLVNASSRTVGVLFSNIFNPVYSSIISGIESRAHESGYNIIISNATDYQSSVQALNMLVSKMIDGLIILPVEPKGMNNGLSSKHALGEMWQFYEDLKNLLARRNLPCVVIDIDINSDLVEYVCHDYTKAARIGIQYLIGAGFRKIFQINSELKEGLWKDRQDVYEKEMRAAGLESEIRVEYCANSTEDSFDLVRRLLENGDVPEAFYCANDILAIGAMQAIHSCSMSIPKDISVMGNDGIYVGEMIIPALTTVDIDSLKVGERAMEACHNFIEGRRTKHKILIEPRLLRRKSVTEKTQGNIV
jgi:periplasmic binding protein/lacI transcriptional regulator